MYRSVTSNRYIGPAPSERRGCRYAYYSWSSHGYEVPAPGSRWRGLTVPRGGQCRLPLGPQRRCQRVPQRPPVASRCVRRSSRTSPRRSGRRRGVPGRLPYLRGRQVEAGLVRVRPPFAGFRPLRGVQEGAGPAGYSGQGPGLLRRRGLPKLFVEPPGAGFFPVRGPAPVGFPPVGTQAGWHRHGHDVVLAAGQMVTVSPSWHPVGHGTIAGVGYHGSRTISRPCSGQPGAQPPAWTGRAGPQGKVR